MKVKFVSILLIILLSPFALLQSVWASSSVDTGLRLQGSVFTDHPLKNAPVTIVDTNGHQVTTQTDDQGLYSIDISSFTAPLLLSSYDDQPIQGKQTDNCTHSNELRANCVIAIAFNLDSDKINIVNLNPFTDLIASEVASQLGWLSASQWLVEGSPKQVTKPILDKAYAQFYALFDPALKQLHLTQAQFDPMTSSQPELNQMLSLIHHQRGYVTERGVIGKTMLLDPNYRLITKEEPFDYLRAKREANKNKQAKVRIFIAGDSTAANYERKVLPRMGFGQVLADELKEGADVIILNGAQSGRSSRSFYNEGWLGKLEKEMQPGDYLIIAFGHNDEKCGGSQSARDAFDIANTCTYPNDDKGLMQHPADQPEYSFQWMLEQYIAVAKRHQVTPILMTPVTRFKNGNNKNAYQGNDHSPVVSTHYTKPKSGRLFSGDYIETVKRTAQDKQIPLIDLEALSIEFANAHATDWQNYWLVVDPEDSRYPYYKTQSSGTILKPDTTHFQQRGAKEMARLIAAAIKQHPQLQALSADFQ